MMRMAYKKEGKKWYVMNWDMGIHIWECKTKKEAIAMIVSYGQVPVPYVPPAERVREEEAVVWQDVCRRM